MEPQVRYARTSVWRGGEYRFADLWAIGAGEILVSDVVRGMARTSAGVVFEDRGEQEMKGVGEAVRVNAVRGSA